MIPPLADVPTAPVNVADPAALSSWIRRLGRSMQNNYQRLSELGQAIVGKPVASAAAIVASSNIFHVTGTTGITSIAYNGFPLIVLIFDGAVTVTDGGNLKLAGNFVTTADDTLTLAFDGTNWYEVHRSVN